MATIPLPAGVKFDDVRAYFETAPPMADAGPMAAMQRTLSQQQKRLGVEFSHHTECRGNVCQTVLEVESLSEAWKLEQLELSRGIELLYQAAVYDLRKVEVTVFTTVPGKRFAEILNSGSPAGS